MDTRTASPSTQHLSRPEGRIAYDVSGSGPLVLCVPGPGDLRFSFRYLRSDLVDAGHRVATMDLRGHGESDPSFSSYEWADTASDLLALIEELGGTATVVASCAGAGAAVWAAAEEGDRVSRLVLLGPLVRDVHRSFLERIRRRLVLRWPWGKAAWLSRFRKLFRSRRPPDFEEHRERIAATLSGRGRWRAFARTSRASQGPVGERLARVRKPTLVVMGGRDPEIPDPRTEAEVVSAWLDATTLIVPEGGHYPHVEFPEVVGPEVVEFLGGLR